MSNAQLTHDQMYEPIALESAHDALVSYVTEDERGFVFNLDLAETLVLSISYNFETHALSLSPIDEDAMQTLIQEYPFVNELDVIAETLAAVSIFTARLAQ